MMLHTCLQLLDRLLCWAGTAERSDTCFTGRRGTDPHDAVQQVRWLAGCGLQRTWSSLWAGCCISGPAADQQDLMYRCSPQAATALHDFWSTEEEGLLREVAVLVGNEACEGRRRRRPRLSKRFATPAARPSTRSFTCSTDSACCSGFW